MAAQLARNLYAKTVEDLSHVALYIYVTAL